MQRKAQILKYKNNNDNINGQKLYIKYTRNDSGKINHN